MRFDIRCLYVFSKIPFISFFAVLFAMAGDKSSGWQEATRVIKRLKREDAPPIFHEFNSTFEDDLNWFQGHINLYRNKFVEHPHSASRGGAMVLDGRGARLVGIAGSGFSVEDEALLSRSRP